MKVRATKFKDCHALASRPNETDISHLALTVDRSGRKRCCPGNLSLRHSTGHYKVSVASERRRNDPIRLPAGELDQVPAIGFSRQYPPPGTHSRSDITQA